MLSDDGWYRWAVLHCILWLALTPLPCRVLGLPPRFRYLDRKFNTKILCAGSVFLFPLFYSLPPQERALREPKQAARESTWQHATLQEPWMFFFPSFFLFNLQRDARVWISSLGIFPWPVGREHTHSRDSLVQVTGWVVDLGAPVGSKHNQVEVSRRKHFLFIHWVMEGKLCLSFSC